MCLGFPAQANPSRSACCCVTQAKPLGSLGLSLLVFQRGATAGLCPGVVEVQPDPAPRTGRQHLAVCMLTLGGPELICLRSPPLLFGSLVAAGLWDSESGLGVGHTENGKVWGLHSFPRLLSQITPPGALPSPMLVVLVTAPGVPSSPCLYRPGPPWPPGPDAASVGRRPCSAPSPPASARSPALRVSPSTPASASTCAPYRAPFSGTPGLLF